MRVLQPYIMKLNEINPETTKRAYNLFKDPNIAGEYIKKLNQNWLVENSDVSKRHLNIMIRLFKNSKLLGR